MFELVFQDEGALSEVERDLVREICSSTESKIRGFLPLLADVVRIDIRVGKDVIPLTGEIGGALAPGHLYWMVDHALEQSVEDIAQSRLPPTLFHECHHLVRGWVMSGGELPKTFMHGVVSEGLATAFEREATGIRPPYGEYPDEVDDWVHELLELPTSASYVDWMFVHPDGRIWIGYRAGTYIADQASKASGKSASELVHAPSDEIMRMAGYEV